MSIESEKSNNILMKLMKSLFKFLFKGGNSLTGNEVDRQEQSNLIFQCGEAGNTLGEMSKDSLEKGDIVKSYMYQCQKVVTDKLQDLLSSGEDLSLLKDKDLNEISIDIHEKLKELSGTNEVEDGFQDYHNHDKALLSSSAKEVNAHFNAIFDDLGSNSLESLSVLSEFATDKVVSHMSQIPETPAEKAGIAPEKSMDNEKSMGRERSNDKDMDLDDSPSPSMAP